MLTVDIDSNSGFCAGVIRAIGKAEEFLQDGEQGKKLYSLGAIVHNDAELARLVDKGLVTKLTTINGLVPYCWLLIIFGQYINQTRHKVSLQFRCCRHLIISYQSSAIWTSLPLRHIYLVATNMNIL